MPYVKRSKDGGILSLHRDNAPDLDEFLPEDSAEIIAFLYSGSKKAEELERNKEIVNDLEASDQDMIRVLEDLINVLISKRVIVMTDLPHGAQRKLAKRLGLRSQMQDLGPIVDDSEEIILP